MRLWLDNLLTMLVLAVVFAVIGYFLIGLLMEVLGFGVAG